MRIKSKPEEKARYFRIMGDPNYRVSLKLETDNDIAKYLGVGAGTIAKWKKKFRDNGKEINGFNLHSFLTDNKEDIAKNLLRVIKESRSSNAIEFALKQLGELTNDGQVVNFNSSEIADTSGQFIEYLKERLNEAGVCPVCGGISESFKEVIDGSK